MPERERENEQHRVSTLFVLQSASHYLLVTTINSSGTFYCSRSQEPRKPSWSALLCSVTTGMSQRLASRAGVSWERRGSARVGRHRTIGRDVAGFRLSVSRGAWGRRAFLLRLCSFVCPLLSRRGAPLWHRDAWSRGRPYTSCSGLFAPKREQDPVFCDICCLRVPAE